MNEEQSKAINAILTDFVTQANVHPLVDELQHKKDQYGDSILTEYNAVTIRAEKNEHDMKRKFIEIMKTKQGFNQFVEALIKTEQTAFVHRLNVHLPVAMRIDVQAVRDRSKLEKDKLISQSTSPTSTDSNSGGNPIMTHAMDKSSKSKLTKNGNSVCNAITISVLEQINTEMKARGHLTTVDVQHIESKPMPYSRNTVLLDILRTRTQQAYADFLDILRDEEIGLAWLADRIEGIATHPENIPKQDLNRKVSAVDQSNKKDASSRRKNSSASKDSPEDAKDHLPKSIIMEALMPAERSKYILKYGIFGALLICALSLYYFPLNTSPSDVQSAPGAAGEQLKYKAPIIPPLPDPRNEGASPVEEFDASFEMENILRKFDQLPKEKIEKLKKRSLTPVLIQELDDWRSQFAMIDMQDIVNNYMPTVLPDSAIKKIRSAIDNSNGAYELSESLKKSSVLALFTFLKGLESTKQNHFFPSFCTRTFCDEMLSIIDKA
uniref:CARD domain-containing protein n=1 Tax=Plectus sambesii TaxID=2011161 RepID=A0A914X814_9BILA